MMKKLKIIGLILAAPASLLATGLSFQTLNPSVGDLLTSSGSELPLTTSARFGTLESNANFNTATTNLFTYSDFNSEFTSLVTASVVEASPNNFTATLAAGSISAGLNLWLLVDSGSEQGVFYVGQTPALGQLVVTPETIGNGTGGSDIAIGSSSGNNILLAVPEPSTYAALAGLVALGAVMLRRRRA